MPVGFHAQQRSRLAAVTGVNNAADLASLRAAARAAWAALAESGDTVEESAFLKRIDARNDNLARRELQRLVDRGMVSKKVSLPRPRAHRYNRMLIPGHLPAEPAVSADGDGDGEGDTGAPAGGSGRAPQ